MKSEKIDSIVAELVDRKVIGKKDVDAARVCLAALMVGENSKEARKIAGARNFRKYWSNLKRNQYFQQNKVCVDPDFDKSDVPFIMMVLAAQGYVQTRWA